MEPIFQFISDSKMEKDQHSVLGNREFSNGQLLDAFSQAVTAYRAGLQEGDVIIGFDDEPVNGIDDIYKLLSERQLGAKSTLTIIRGTDKIQIDIIPEESN